MRLALLLLFASAVQAQPVVGPEVVWRTAWTAATFHPARQAAPVAADRGGYVVAWSEVGEGGIAHAFAGRLDPTGQLAAVGVQTSGAADAPSIAPFGDRYIAAWLEPGIGVPPTLVIGSLDRDFRLSSARLMTNSVTAPLVRTTAARAYVAAGNLLYEVDRDGVPASVYNAPQGIDDAAAFGDQAGYVLHATEATGVTGSIVCPGHPCNFPPPPPPKYTVSFTWLFRLTAGFTLPVKNDAPVAVGSSCGAFLVVWSEPAGIKASFFGATFDPFTISARPITDASAQPQVAWDGARWLVVWPAGESIAGAAITPDREVTPFMVSARGARPAIAAAARGRFLVTYEIVDVTGRRLAARAVDFPQRQRAVR